MFTIESINQFLKPDLRKVFLTVVFYLASVSFVVLNTICLMMVGIHCPSSSDIAVSLAPLMVIFYIISCLLIFAWGKIKNKKQ